MWSVVADGRQLAVQELTFDQAIDLERLFGADDVVSRAFAERVFAGGGDGSSNIRPVTDWSPETFDPARVSRLGDTLFFIGDDGQADAALWQSEVGALVTIPPEIEAVVLKYSASPALRANIQGRERRVWYGAPVAARPWPTVRAMTAIDVVGAIGSEGVSVAGGSGTRYEASLTIPTQGLPGLLFAKPLHWIARRISRPSRDGDVTSRREEHERRIDTSKYPELSGQHRTRRLGVLVHGFASTAADMAFRLGPTARRFARFEHDTFLPIDDNADELCGLLTPMLDDATSLLLVCHSRGGLVARRAVQGLGPVNAHVTIITLGAPHSGTELASFGTFPRLAAQLTTRGVSALSRLRSVLPRSPVQGALDMVPDSPFLKMLNRIPGHHDALVCFGADCRGASLTVGERLLASFSDPILTPPHDVVVPLSSAMSVGSTCQISPNCGHSSYLGSSQVRACIGAAP